jgi:hypothetical protein
MRFFAIIFAFLFNLSKENLFNALVSFANVQFMANPKLQYNASQLHKERMERMKADEAKGVMPMNQERAILKYLESVYDPGVIVTKSWLSNAVQMGIGAIQALKFNFQETNQRSGTVSNSPVDNLLNMVDTFEVTGFRLAMFKLPATAAGSGLVAGNYGNAQKEYFPNPNVFFGIVGGTEYLNMNNVFNAALYIKIDSTVFYETMQVADLLKAGITQQGLAYSAVAAAPGTPNQDGGLAPWTSGDTRDIKMDCTPMFMLNGSGKNDIIINLFEATVLASLDASPPAYINFVELQLLGFLCQGGAKQGVRKG